MHIATIGSLYAEDHGLGPLGRGWITTLLVLQRLRLEWRLVIGFSVCKSAPSVSGEMAVPLPLGCRLWWRGKRERGKKKGWGQVAVFLKGSVLLQPWKKIHPMIMRHFHSGYVWKENIDCAVKGGESVSHAAFSLFESLTQVLKLRQKTVWGSAVMEGIKEQSFVAQVPLFAYRMGGIQLHPWSSCWGKSHSFKWSLLWSSTLRTRSLCL